MLVLNTAYPFMYAAIACWMIAGTIRSPVRRELVFSLSCLCAICAFAYPMVDRSQGVERFIPLFLTLVGGFVILAVVRVYRAIHAYRGGKVS